MRPGILLVNKPSGMTSHDVVDAVRRMTGEQRVGHAGTLDPFATGVLVVGVGREATKTLGWITAKTDKRYHATVRLGAESDTGDPEGVIRERENVQPPKKQEIERVLQTFSGMHEQVPPAYSSVKVHGVRSYDRARRGEHVVLPPRTITIHSLSIRRFTWPELEIDVTCSSGTYIRSLARDIGEKLRTGGYLTMLCRTAVGDYILEHAHTLEEIAAAPEQFLLPVPRNTDSVT
ncbi:MAG: tRNA pseudouridine(55) synthase TruB [bacterium]